MVGKILLLLLLFSVPNIINIVCHARKRPAEANGSASASGKAPVPVPAAPPVQPEPAAPVGPAASESAAPAAEEPSAAQPAADLPDEFDIHNGTVLCKYLGNSKCVRVPDGVKIINVEAFMKTAYEKIWIAPEEGTYRSDSSRADEYRWAAGKTSQRSYSVGVDFIREVILPDSVEEIGLRAFGSCTDLKRIRFSANLKSIGLSAFEYCTKLQNVDLPDPVWIIGSSAFRGCKSLENVRLPASLRIMYSCAFAGCSSLKRVELPEGVREIASGVFSGCTNLSHVRLPDGLLRIRDNAFAYCRSLKRIEVPADTVIDKNAFNMTDVEIVRRPKKSE